MFKKIILTFLIISFVFSCFGVSAFDAAVNTVTNRVNVSGKITEGEVANRPVTLLVVKKDANVSNLKKDDIAYVMQSVSDDNGAYDFRFSFECNASEVSNYKVMVNSDEGNINNTILRAASFSDLFEISLDIDYDLKNMSLDAVIDNIYSVQEQTCLAVIAFYDDADKLLNVKISSPIEIKKEITEKSFSADVPIGTSKISGFLWSDLNSIVPLTEKVDDNTIDLLIIGSSVGRDSVDLLHDMAAKKGIQLNVLNIYRGNGRFQQMYESIVSDSSSAYTFYFNNDDINGRGTEGLMTIKEALQYRDWDYISLQQGAWAANNYDSFNSQEDGGIQWFDEILKTVRTIRPESEILLHMTWAHADGKPSPEDGKTDEKVVYEEIVDTYTRAAAHAATLYTDDGKCVSLNGQPLRLIPNAKAFYDARNSEDAMFKTTYSPVTEKVEGSPSVLLQDGRHATNYGKMLAASVWYEALTGEKCIDNPYHLDMGISEITFSKIAEYAHGAILEYGWQQN